VRLHRLELTGFGPFRETQTVDFDAFEADGIFLISGRTGAGKSSVLDGVCFALYGNVPRYDGPDKRLRSDHCRPQDPTEVRLEFTVGEKRWRVVRSPEYERPKLRGDGMTVETARAELFERVGDEWVGRAGKPRDVAEVLDGVLGVNLQQFQQVILLAQNKFSRFLLAKNDERQTLLRTLFGTRRYQEYADAVDARRKEATQVLRDRRVGVDALMAEAERLIEEADLQGDHAPPPETDLGARLEAAVLAVQRAEYRVESLEQERRAAESAAEAAAAEFTRVSAIRVKQTARISAEARLAELEAAEPELAIDRLRAERASEAEALRAPLDAAARAREALDEAARAEDVARDAWVASGEAADADLDRIDEEITGDLARWQVARAAEAELAAAEAEHADLVRRLAEEETALAGLAERRAALPAERERITEESDRVRSVAGGAPAALVVRDTMRTRLEAARAADALAPRVTAAESAYADAVVAAGEAGAALTDHLRRRLADHAGELASALVEGEACAVCGSPTHPDPARPTGDPVTDEMIADAEARRERAVAAERSSAEEARRLRAEHAALTARAGGEAAAELEARLENAETVLADALAAERRSAELRERREALVRLDDQLGREHDALAAEAARIGAAAAGVAATTQRLRETVAAARGAHASVADRVSEATARRERARTLRDAQRVRLAAATAAATADAALAEALAASSFRTAEECRAALLAPGAAKELRERIAAHEQETAVEKARLLDLQLELVGAPDELVDPSDADTARAAAAAARSAAITAVSVARSTAERLRDLVERADAAYADVAALDADATAVVRLADTLQGKAPNTKRMTLETFVLAAELEEIVAAANVRLGEMSSGRYTLQHTDSLAARGAASGLGIAVMDAHTGQSRSPQSLSGGETFLASLALALGLAEVVTSRAGGIRLDTLFVDEGFGSLDPETLELAMRALDELRAGGRTVGVISHVEAMKEQLPARLIVEATPQGPSVIRRS